MNKDAFDVIVVGGGHAGVEAALASARLGCQTLLITQMANAIARMPCNPSIGGIAKSHLVFELDALGGEMARNTDDSGIQFRILNASRGPAVQANRAQCDKAVYAHLMQHTLEQTRNLTILEDEVVSILPDGAHRIGKVHTGRSGILTARAVVVTTGTAMTGTIHIGSEVQPGGGDGRPAAQALSESLRSLGFNLTRFKTGTPPRLDGRTIDWNATAIQPGDESGPLFSWNGRRKLASGDWKGIINPLKAEFNAPMFHVEHSPTGQIPCWLTHTTAETHRIIRDNLEKSALYGGGIVGTGVRYCPSIEDKVVKFHDKESHHVFLEPEGLNTHWIYPNGISNSLDRNVQVALVHSIPGLEQAEFLSFAYAIEYDCIDTLDLLPTLASRRINNLFFAGQINRTTGYEEAAAQGFIAGVNAAQHVLERDPFVISRQDAYMGVLIDDLITKGTNEPYRMFTSRSERRLILRQDNARFRLFKQAQSLGLVDRVFLDETAHFVSLIEQEEQRLAALHENGVHLDRLLARPGTRYRDLPDCNCSLPSEVIEQIEIRMKYHGYILQEERAADRARRDESMLIPTSMDYWKIETLRFEARENFDKLRPISVAQASRIPGITPSDLITLTIALKKQKAEKA